MARKLTKRQLLRGLGALGFQQVSQRGSHLKFKRKDPEGEVVVIVPNFREIPAGTVQSILRQAQTNWNDFQDLI